MEQNEMAKIHLLGMTKQELQAVAEDCGMPKFAAKQMTDWIYIKRVTSVDEMTNISLIHREKLSEKYDVGRNEPVEFQESEDGTVKYLFRTENDKLIETVMIPDEERGRYTLCVSSQVGCKMNCTFCMTGKQGFQGNLTSNEILNQLYSVREAEKLTNVVFMGMGEPLDNYEQLKKTLDIMLADYALAWSPKRITVSTTGVTPKLKLLLDDTEVHIAISIHTPIKEERESMMPVEKAYPMAEVLTLLGKYDWAHQRRLSFEYIMFNGFNDTLFHARELSKQLKGLDCRVNLIRYHAIPNVDLKTSTQGNMEQFRDYLTQRKIISTIRTSRGEDIFAACGMLSTVKSEEKEIKITE